MNMSMTETKAREGLKTIYPKKIDQRDNNSTAHIEHFSKVNHMFESVLMSPVSTVFHTVESVRLFLNSKGEQKTSPESSTKTGLELGTLMLKRSIILLHECTFFSTRKGRIYLVGIFILLELFHKGKR